MKSLVEDERGNFNKRTRSNDAKKDSDVFRKALVIENGEIASRLLKNKDFALMFNLYRFEMLERLEDSSDDSERISNAQYVAGVRDFVVFIEKQEFLAKVANKSVETLTKED
jgi:hypothetical protein